MRNWFGILLFVASTNPDTRRRGRILISITLGVIGLGSSFIPLLLTSPQHTLILSIMGGVALLFLGGAYLGRQGRVTAGSYVMIGTAVIVILSSIYTNRSAPYGPFYLILAVLLAGVLLPPIQIWLVFLICAIGTVVVSGWLPTDIRTNPLWVQSLRGGPLLMLISSIIIFISARSASVAMRETQEARTEAEAAMQRLAENNAGLEARVAERTTELTRVLAEQQATMAQLEQSLASQRDMNRVIAELSVPIIPISDDALVVPLIGAIDSGRADQLLGNLLSEIEQHHIRTIILDVTGVAVIDTQVAGALLQVADAARLMGTRTILVGIRPEVAQTLVGLGVDLNTLQTAAGLQDGLALARKFLR